MIIRVSQKLGKKIKVLPAKSLAITNHPHADWSCHLFTADRTQYVLATNTASLYSTVLYGKGIVSDSQLIVRILDSIRDVMVDDGMEFLYLRLIAPETETICFSKALNRSVTGSMNDLIFHAKAWLVESDLSPFDVSFKLNDIPMSALKYQKPREAVKLLSPAKDCS